MLRVHHLSGLVRGLNEGEAMLFVSECYELSSKVVQHQMLSSVCQIMLKCTQQ